MAISPVVWFIDEEWKDYEVETVAFKRAYPDCEIAHSGNDFQKDLSRLGPRVDAILAQIYVNLDAEAIQKLDRCKVISVWGGGYDRVDTVAAADKGITVTFVPNYCAEDVSDYVIASVYHFSKKMGLPQIDGLRDGLWGYQALQCMATRVAGAVLLVIGLGRIGSTVARKAVAMGMKVLACDPYVDGTVMSKLGVTKVDLAEGLKVADFVSLNLKLTAETDGLLSDERMALLKRTCCVINTGRGRTLDEAALVRRVCQGLIGGAYLDVVSVEPPHWEEPVFHTPGIFVTPHISYLSEASFFELKSRAAGNALRVLRGEPVADRADH